MTSPTDKQRDLQHDRPSVTNRTWGIDRDPGDQSFGTREQGGFGDFRTPAPETGRDGKTGGSADGEASRHRPDDRVRAAVAHELARDGTIDAAQVLVAAEDGVLTLTGEVPKGWMKARAEDVAARVQGVREVRNLLRHDDGSASFGPPGEAVRSEGAPRR